MKAMRPIRDELLMDLTETVESQGYLPMYDFAWTLRGYATGLDPEDVAAISMDVYKELVRKYPLQLMWTMWPIDTERAWAAEDDTTLDFDLDPQSPLDQPLLVLVERP